MAQRGPACKCATGPRHMHVGASHPHQGHLGSHGRLWALTASRTQAIVLKTLPLLDSTALHWHHHPCHTPANQPNLPWRLKRATSESNTFRLLYVCSSGHLHIRDQEPLAFARLLDYLAGCPWLSLQAAHTGSLSSNRALTIYLCLGFGVRSSAEHRHSN